MALEDQLLNDFLHLNMEQRQTLIDFAMFLRSKSSVSPDTTETGWQIPAHDLIPLDPTDTFRREDIYCE